MPATSVTARLALQKKRILDAGFKIGAGKLFLPVPLPSVTSSLRSIITSLCDYMRPSNSPGPFNLWPGNQIWEARNMADFFCDTAWFNMVLIIGLCSMKQRTLNSQSSHSKVVFVPELFQCLPNPIITWEVKQKRKGLSNVPFPNLGLDASWRNKTIVSVVGADENHYVTVLIDGPRRVTAVFDGFAGGGDASNLKKVRPSH